MTIPRELFANDFATVLAGNGGSITSGATTFETLASPSILASNGASPPTQYRAIVDTQAGVIYANTEIMTITNMSSGVWTATRASESVPGGCAQNAPVAHNDGADITLIVSAGSLTELLQAADEGLFDLAGSAATAQSNAETFATGVANAAEAAAAAASDPAGSATAALATAEAFTTSAIAAHTFVYPSAYWR